MKFKSYRIVYFLLCVPLLAHAQDVESLNDDSAPLEDSFIKAKSEKSRKMVEDAVKKVKKDGIAVSCKSFLDDPQWRIGEMYIWVFDTQGNCYCHGYEKDSLWKNFANNEEDDFIKRMAQTGKMGGFINYKWNNGYSRAYVKNVKVGKKTYIIGSGFYPTSSVYIVEELMSSAVDYLKRTSLIELKERINNPTGIFVRGDIHLEMFTFDGICVANGEQAALVGQNLMEATTGDGKFIVRDVIQIARTKGEGWYEFHGFSGREPARAFVKKIVDPVDNKPYVLMCSYYTNINDQTVMSLVKKATNFLKANGREIAFREFSMQSAEFIVGNVNIFVYDMKGTMVADSKNPAFVGLNLINTRDAEGRPVTRQILEMADMYGKGWVTNALSNSYQVVYCEKVSVPDGDYVIGAAYFPVGKENFVRFMLEDAYLFLENNPLEESLRKFVIKSSNYLRGDINIFVYTIDGICLADGLNLNKIWGYDTSVKDENGVKIMDKIIAVAKTGGGWIKFNVNNAVCNIYIKTIDKADKNSKPEIYIIGSGYFE